tara:strand:+ start:306 stop:908 length:603 start_codon:yes stop_codon:yes gene_type:complete
MIIKVTTNGACFLILVELLGEEITLLKELVMVSAWTVNVTMRQFFLGGRANLDDLYLEAEGLACHLVVEVGRNYVTVNIGDGELDGALVAMRPDNHPYFQFHTFWELASLYLLDGSVVPLSVSSIGSEGELPFLPHLSTENLLLETLNHLPVPNHEDQRVLALAAVEFFSIYECPGVMHRCYRVLLYCIAHVRGPEGSVF